MVSKIAKAKYCHLCFLSAGSTANYVNKIFDFIDYLFCSVNTSEVKCCFIAFMTNFLASNIFSN